MIFRSRLKLMKPLIISLAAAFLLPLGVHAQTNGHIISYSSNKNEYIEQESYVGNNPEVKKIEDFVKRMYRITLGREAEADGLNYYVTRLQSGEMDGSSVAQGFVGSPEFQGKKLSADDYLAALYSAFFDRTPGSAEVQYWKDEMASGLSRRYVLRGFVNSPEFERLCQSAGIIRGEMVLAEGEEYEIDEGKLGAFVDRLYEKALRRDAEPGGRQYYIEKISNREVTPEQAAKNFFFSDEFEGFRTNDAEYIERLYETFMDRAAELEGLNYWLDNLRRGMSREEALSRFAASDEFKKIMNGITAQDPAPNPDPDPNPSPVPNPNPSPSPVPNPDPSPDPNPVPSPAPNPGQEIESPLVVNSTKVTLYAMDKGMEDYLTIPEDMATSFQLTVSGASNPTYQVIGFYPSVEVSSDGLITPRYETSWYRGYLYDTPTTVRVTAGNQSVDVVASVLNYANVYADQVMEKYIADNITASMTAREKIEQACKFAASYEYSVYYQSAASMIIYGGGDCWASTDAIVKICNKLGMKAWGRSAYRDYSVGSGHYNAMVEADGIYYEAEAGFAMPAPRGYEIIERTSLYKYYFSYFSDSNSYDGIKLHSYDGPERIAVQEIPEEIDGYKVVGIEQKFLYNDQTVKMVKLPPTLQYINDNAFGWCTELQSIEIPASVREISDTAFDNCSGFTIYAPQGSYAETYARRKGYNYSCIN